VVQWAVRDELAAGAKASKATARKASADTEFLAATKHSDRKNAAVYETLATCRSDRAEHPDTALGIAEAAHERYIAASTEKKAAAAGLLEAKVEHLAAVQELIKTKKATEPDDEDSEDSDDEELPWEWDFIGPGSSQAEIRSELEDMLCGVALADAGFASCAACAWLFIRNAQQLALDMDSSPHPLHLTDAYRSAWDRSRLLTDTVITAESWAAAAYSSSRCHGCAGVGASTLTAAGEAAGREAAAGAAELNSVVWLQRRQQPERAREADILAHGTFYWDGERQGSVLVAVPTWLGDVDAARDFLSQQQAARGSH
jgi:hypothetical protein